MSTEYLTRTIMPYIHLFLLIIMAGDNTCNICCKKVLRHCHHRRCTLCKSLVHIKCLPYVTKSDTVYTLRDMDDWYCIICTSNLFPFNQISEESEFLSGLSENWTTPNVLPYDLLHKQNIFQPFELNDNQESPLFDLDPDLQFYNTHCNAVLNSCDYYLEDTFNTKMSKLKVNDKSFSLIHVNVRSAAKNLSRFEAYLSNLCHTFNIIALSENWLNENNHSLYDMLGYQSEHRYRPNRGGGGVSLLIKNNIEYFVRPDLCLQTRYTESLFIEIDKSFVGKQQDVIIGVMYRPPDTDMKVFNENLGSILSKTKAEKKLLYILADFNINLLNADTHEATHDFLDIMYSNSLLPTITKPTRVTEKSATLIDNIFSNSLLNTQNIVTGIMYCDVTDHFPIFHIDYTADVQSDEIIVKKRIYSESNVTSFSSALKNHSWHSVLSDNDPQTAYTSFIKAYMEIYNSCFPLKSFKHGYKTRKSWLSENLKKAIKIKNRLYRKSNRSQDPEYFKIYKKFRNKLNGMLTKAEKEHYSKLREEHKNNLKTSWNVIKDVINKNKSKGNCSRFLVNGKTTSNKDTISNGFNSFFVNIGPSLANKIPPDGRSPSEFVKTNVIDSIVMDGVLADEVIKIIRNVKEGSSGWDDISASVVKKTYSSFIEPITHILNISITKGVFPNELKIAKVIPLFKSGDTMIFSNYRPVSVLPVFSKILERLMYNRLLGFINKHRILYMYQFGFRADHSPNLALLLLVDKLSKALEEGEYVLGLFLDFSKAFDTVNHTILFTKLEHYGIRGVALNMFKSYLSNRHQYVVYNDTKSENRVITCGVPQGSILGPLLFLLYINDLADVSSVLFSLLFADDSNMFLTGNDPNELIRIMNTEIVKVVDWLRVNKLSLNLKKTHFILFRQQQRSKITISEELIIDHVNIEMKDSTKFLGVMVDKFLNFEEHVKYIKGKISRGLGIIRKCRRVFQQKTLVTIYNSFLLPYFNFCTPVWGNTHDSYLEPLILLQKRAVRLVIGAKRNAHTDPIFKKLKLLKLRQIYIYSVQQFVYKYHHGLLPRIFDDFYSTNSSFHYHHTRSQNLYRPPLVRTSRAARTIRSVGVRTQTYFSTRLSMNCSLLTYKAALKRYIIENDVNTM